MLGATLHQKLKLQLVQGAGSLTNT